MTDKTPPWVCRAMTSSSNDNAHATECAQHTPHAGPEQQNAAWGGIWSVAAHLDYPRYAPASELI